MNAFSVVMIAASLSVQVSAFAQDQGPFFDPAQLDKIIGGEVVEESDPIAISTVLVINKTTDGTAICTGSIIADDLVMTAGHCVGPDKKNMKIVFRRTMG